MKYLLLISLGPVQEFIGNSRRTRDLHFSSWLISELARAAARKLSLLDGYLIFPAPVEMESLEPNHQSNVANRIVALIEGEPRIMADQVRAAVDEQLYKIRDEAYAHIALHGKKREIAEKQIKELVEFVWVSLPYPDHASYRETRQLLEALMAARKNTYVFSSSTENNPVPKSSLDGQLESVIPEDAYPPRGATPQKKQDALRSLYEKYKVAGLGEQLSGVDLLKRLGKTAFDTHFPRTSHIAALSFIQRMKRIDEEGQRKLKADWESYIEQLNALKVVGEMEEHISQTYPDHPILGHYDGAFLFEDRLADLLMIPPADKGLGDKPVQAREALHKFYKSLEEQFKKVSLSEDRRPAPYYAFLQADGDGMGDLIDAVAGEEYKGYGPHRELSQALSQFAQNVRTMIVGEYQGALVYAGGDDVLAFLPLHTMLACAMRLREEFQKALEGIAHSVNCQPPTLSMGIAIMHHLDALSEARRLAHDAEQRAKRNEGKDSLSIVLSKRGGEEYRVVGKWGSIDTQLVRLIAYCRTASIPAGMAYEVRDMVLRLSVPKNDKHYAELQKVIRRDTLRILLRKLTVPAGKVSPEKVKEIEDFLRRELGLPPREESGEAEAGVASSRKEEWEQDSSQTSIEQFVDELVIAQELARAAELAQEGV